MQQLALAADAAAVSPFQFHTHTVRVITTDGEPWFVAADVADALGYRDAATAARHVDEKHRGTRIVRTPSGDQPMTVVNESGLYRLVLRSRKPEAIAFSDWVTGEVLPSIRKTGGYGDTANFDRCRAMAHAAGLAAERETLRKLLTGDLHPRVLAWVQPDYRQPDKYIGDAKAIADDAVCIGFADLARSIEQDGLAAGTSTEDLLALANACISRVKQRETSRIASEKRRAIA